MDGSGGSETSGEAGALTQEVAAMLCVEEEISSRREELERTGELRALRAAREHVQVSDVCLLVGIISLATASQILVMSWVCAQCCYQPRHACTSVVVLATQDSNRLASATQLRCHMACA